MKIRTRLLLAFLIVVSISFYVVIQLVTREIRPRYLESMEESLVDTAFILAAYVETNSSDDLRKLTDKALNQEVRAQIYSLTKTQIALQVYVTDELGMVTFDSHEGDLEGQDYSKWNNVMRTLRGEYGARSTREDPKDPSSSVLHVSAPIRSGEKITGTLTVAKPLDSLTPFIASAQRRIFLVGALVAVSATVMAVLISFWLTFPIRQLTQYALSIRDGRRAVLPKLGGGEVGSLGEAFEQMRDSLEGKKYIEQYVQTLTHEIKSPLTGIRGAAELLSEKPPEEDTNRFIGNIRDGVERIQLLINRLLDLSALETRKQLDKPESFSLEEVAKDSLQSVEAQAKKKNLKWELKWVSSRVVSGDRFLLTQAITNLLQNAIDFSPEGAQVQVSLNEKEGHLVLEVIDQGPGFPDFAKTRLFERFFSLPRPDSGKKSSGLGLSFVKEVCELHEGHIELESVVPHGVRAILSIPIH